MRRTITMMIAPTNSPAPARTAMLAPPVFDGRWAISSTMATMTTRPRTKPTTRRTTFDREGRGAPSGPPGPTSDVVPSGKAFDDHRVRHAAAFAHGLQPVARAATLEFVQQRRAQTRTGRTERVAECDRAAV